MPTTKSGIETPTTPPTKPLTAPVKVYPGSHNLGKGASKTGGIIVGPASGKRGR